ncbi:ABC transporter ATP-binding protein [uncultured Methanobrevibacter sp.]|uniref:ABC transporter ATP-binding protein n=2 Tax=unclassified Methanobrevibacter TaxID=2638681 RepID=UPI0025DE19F9|nr:ABC transporter ATP-binding protein [uncultured Methanobrevibacter sp.]
MWNIFSPLKKNIKTIIIIIALLVLEAYFTLQLPEYTSKIVDIGIANGDIAYIYSAGTTMIMLTILATITGIIVSLFSCKVASEYSYNLRILVFSKVLKFSNHEHNNISKSTLMTRTTNDVSRIRMILEWAFDVIIFAPAMAIGGIIKTIQLGTNLYWIILMILILIIVFMFFILKKTVPYLIILDKLPDIKGMVREIITGMEVIKTFVREDYESKKFKATNDEFKELRDSIRRYILFLNPLMTLHSSIMIVSILYFGSYQIESGTILTGDLIAFIQYATQIVSSILIIISFSKNLPDLILPIKRVKQVLDTELSIVDGEIGTINERKSTIEFKNVSFKYSKSEKDALTNINFKLEPGKTVAIIGCVGSGKSTILNMIPRFQDPSAGEILINGENIKNLKLKTLRERISLSPQKPHIFKGTVKSNMTLSDPNASDENIIYALEKANANFIDSLDDEVLTAGLNFSEGQKQCLSIARSILKDSDFYLFDDSFSSFDLNTEKIIKKNLKELKGSSILIASQRISTIKDADEILVLDDGQIVDRGSHNRLLESCEIYREIVKSQNDILNGGK